MIILIWLIILSLILSIRGFLIRFIKSRNHLLLGKIASRLLLLISLTMYLEHQSHIFEVFIGIIALNLSDFMYDIFNYAISKKRASIISAKFLTEHRFLDTTLPVFILSAETGKFEYINDSMLNLLQLNKEDLIGKEISEVFAGITLDMIKSNRVLITADGIRIVSFPMENGKKYIAGYLY